MKVKYRFQYIPICKKVKRFCKNCLQKQIFVLQYKQALWGVFSIVRQGGEMGRYKRLLSNTLILALGTFGSKLLVFFMMPLYTACLSESEYGTADLISQTANLLMPLACAGITNGIFRFAMDHGEDKRGVLSSGIAVLLVASAIFLCASPLLFLYDKLGGFAWLVILYVIAANCHAVVAQYIRACGKMTLFSVGGILGTAITIASNLLFLLVWDMGILGYVLSVVVGDVLMTAVLFWGGRVWRDVRFDLARKGKIVEMLGYSLPMIPTVMFWWVTSVSDRFFLVEMKGAEINGLYAAASKIPTLLTLLCSVFIDAWQFSAVSENDEGERSKFFTEVFAGFGGLIFMAASGLMLLSKPITSVLLAESYFVSWEYIPSLSLAMTFSALVTFMGSVYMVRKKSMYSLLTALIGAFVNIVLNALLIPAYSAIGAAVATFISYFVVLIVRSIHTVKLVPFSLGIPRLTANTVLLVGQCILMTSTISWRVPAILFCFGGIVAINGRAILRSMSEFLHNIGKKFKKS